MNENMNVQLDRMRYTKDKFSANMILFAIVLDCLYFVSIYQSDVGSYYYTWTIGASVVYNLLFMLAAFLASESVKSRKSGYTGLLLVIGVMQFVRIAYLPLKAFNATVDISGVAVPVMGGGQFAYTAALLAVSGICCIIAAISSHTSQKKLADYMNSIKN